MEPLGPNLLKRGDEVVLRVDDAAFEGKTIARYEGFVVFVEGAVPGDMVRVRILKSKKNYAEAKVVAVEQPSPHRVVPRCRHFGPCGGCKWQHVDYQVQLRFKQQHVADAFERIGGFTNPNVLPIIGSEEIFFYRNKMEYSFSDKEWLESMPPPAESSSPVDFELRNSNFEIGNGSTSLTTTPQSAIHLGLHVPQRYDKVLEITECHLQSGLSNEILNFTRSFARRENLPVYSSDVDAGYLRFLVIREGKRTNELMVNLVTYEDRPEILKHFTAGLLAAVPEVTTVVNTINSKKAQIAFGDRERVYAGDGVINERFGNLLFTISASSFFQTNTHQAERLYTVAKSLAALKQTDIVWDLYSGTGSIAMFVSDAVRQVVGVESVESAVQDANRNAQANHIENCTFILGDLKDRLTKDREWITSHPRPDVMIIDPPRSGMHPKVVEEILEIAPERIVYVSCNPATQARDVKTLAAKYDITALQPIDMFPHTYHIENVAKLTLRS
ncbi:MAG: 23S rRNA (uracil(1939)-C(5))-methyltransferase RlmD [Ignavibacteria bacterium]|nr:23S rRNA (uracil(1939)-C(5))-methyltransferase RlmD [Ignavibacteria bacterium]